MRAFVYSLAFGSHSTDGNVGVRAVGNALGFRPISGLFVPNAAAGQVCVVLTGQNRPQLERTY